MMKSFGCVLILLSAYACGTYLSKGVKKKTSDLEQVFSAMVYCIELVKKRTPTDIIKLRVKSLYPQAEFEADDMCEFFELLGSCSVGEQLGELEYRCEKMKERVASAREKASRDAGLCRLLPLFFAALLVIILI